MIRADQPGTALAFFARRTHGRRAYRYHIIDCASGGEALALMGVGDRRVDCVLLDQNLPDIDADELLRRLRAPSGDFRPR